MSGPALNPGEYTLLPADALTADALIQWDERRVLVRLKDPGLIHEDGWGRTVDLLSEHTVEVRRADCGAGCRCAAEVRLVPDALDAPDRAAAVEFTVLSAADVMLGINNGGTWGSFTCTEIEALADIFTAAGRKDVADFIISEHAASDEDGDLHTKEEPND